MRPSTRARRWAVLALTGGLILGAGCSSDATTAGTTTAPSTTQVAGTFDPASAGSTTLQVWTAEGGPRLELVQKRIDAFMAKYPNVKVAVTVRDFSAYPAQLKLALTSADAPDVAIGNIGYSLDGPLVKAGLIRDLSPWVERYGWDKRYAEVAQKQLRFSKDGSQFGNGPIFGIPYASDVIGWFYNVDKLKKLGLEIPKTFGELEADLGKAKAASEVPMMLGNKDQWPGSHVFYIVSDNLATTEDITGIVFGADGASWTKQPFIDSAAKIASWSKSGYFVDGYNGLGMSDAAVKFGKGEGLFLPAGSWNAADLSSTMGDNVGFFLTPPNKAGDPGRATGSFGYGWHISTASKQPDLAAALIDWMTNEDSAREFFAIGDIAPLTLAGDAPVMKTKVTQDIFDAWNVVLANDTLLPYIEFSDPNAGEVLFPTIQEILAGKKDPAAGLAEIEAARQKFRATLKP